MECSVCYEHTQDKLICGHILCDTCHKSWLKNHDTCPCCRISLQSYVNTPVVNELYFLSGGRITSLIKH